MRVVDEGLENINCVLRDLSGQDLLLTDLRLVNFVSWLSFSLEHNTLSSQLNFISYYETKILLEI